MNKDIELLKLLESEAKSTERGRNAGPKPNTIITRPGGVRAKVFSVRLVEEEHLALEKAAKDSGISPSTLAREYILQGLAEHSEVETMETIAVALNALSQKLTTMYKNGRGSTSL